MIKIPENSNIVLGVSLGNKAFNTHFCDKLFNALDNANPRSLLIFVGDYIEATNYVVFNDSLRETAKKTANHRGKELVRMFEKRLEKSTLDIGKVNICLETELRKSTEYKEKIQSFTKQFTKLVITNPTFKEKVERQVRINLSGKEDAFGIEFISENLGELCNYILGELAVFFALFEEIRQVVEIYPGSNLAIKEEIIEGRFPVDMNEFKYNFINISEFKKNKELR